MIIETAGFGKLEILEEKIIHFEEGLPGFEEEKDFVIIFNEDEGNPFHYMQSVNNMELFFVIMNPFEIFKDYDFKLKDNIIEKLKIIEENDVTIYTIVVIPEDVEKITTNLMGPLVINNREKLAKQIVLDDEKYTTKHYIFQEGGV